MSFYEVTLQVPSSEAIQPFTKEKVGFEPGNVFFSVETQNVRYWYGGSEPSTISGHLILENQWISFSKSREVKELRIIAIAGTATIQATVEGR